jgi:hypothetical protein
MTIMCSSITLTSALDIYGTPLSREFQRVRTCLNV